MFEYLKLDSAPLTRLILVDSFCEAVTTEIAADQANFRQLNLVCKRFRQVFLEHSELSAELVVPQTNPNATRLLPSLLLWMRRHSGAALKFAALGAGLHQELIIGALSCSMMQLSEVYLTGASNTGLLGLSAFTSVTSCDLNSPLTGSLDLQSLQGLTSLQKLYLTNGVFCQLTLNAELTYIFMLSAEVSCVAHTRTTGLQVLSMESSTLAGLHPHGLTACTSLRSIHIYESDVKAERAEDNVDFKPYRIVCNPVGMSCLTQLSSLCIDIDLTGQEVQQYDLSWVFGVTSLHRLDVTLAGSTEITQDLTKLANLTWLQLSCVTYTYDDSVHYASYFVDWASMQCLKEVVLSGVSRFDDRMLNLARLECLESVCLSDLHLDANSASHLGRLAYKLAQRSDVTFKLGGKHVS